MKQINPVDYKFRTRTGYADCLNTLVEVVGNAFDGIKAVYAIGDGHVGEDILNTLSDAQYKEITEELKDHMATTITDALLEG